MHTYKESLKTQAKALYDILEYVDEKTVGIGFRLVADQGGGSNARRRVLRFYLMENDIRMLSDIIFPWCKNLDSKTGFQTTMYRNSRRTIVDITSEKGEILLMGGRMDVRLTRRFSKKCFRSGYGDFRGLISASFPLFKRRLCELAGLPLPSEIIEGVNGGQRWSFNIKMR
jgi:hypothetical protein